MTGGAARRPVVGIMCGNEQAARPIQAVATRFIAPVTHWCGATVLLVPAVTDAIDVAATAACLDGLLLTGARSHVALASDCTDHSAGATDPERDIVALSLAGRMIDAGKPVFGICPGLQEINVLFGGSLRTLDHGSHLRGSWADDYADLFDHVHPVDLTPGGKLARISGCGRLDVNSVHQMAIDRLGTGLSVEAVAADDAVIEAITAHDVAADVLAVQWHPEWQGAQCPANRGFFTLFGAALARAAAR